VGIFIATPHTAAGAIVDLAPATGLKTILQVGIPAGDFIKICGWGISSTGLVGADSPFYAYLMEGDIAATGGTSLTPDLWDQPGGQASVCVGGTGATAYNAAFTEGTITASRVFDPQKIHPQTGYSVWFPDSLRPMCGLVASARYLRLRVNQITTAYNLVPWVAWSE
jgi:hypothetical protein